MTTYKLQVAYMMQAGLCKIDLNNTLLHYPPHANASKFQYTQDCV